MKLMDLNQAIQKHAEWKLKFRSAMTKQETLDAGVIEKDNCCELGKWLYGDARTQFGALRSYTSCVTRHAAFHKEAAKVARAINAKRFDEANAMLNNGSSYSNCSSAVGVAILELRKDAGI